MAIKFEKVEPGMVLLDIHSHKMGNTTLRELGCWEVKVISVDVTARTAMCSWNGNPARIYRESDFKRLYTKPTKACLAQLERRKKGSSWL
jgi:hypothetical protein